MTGSTSASERKLPARRVVLTWLAATLIAVLITLAAGERMRRGVFDRWQAMQPRDLSASEVRVVLIDEESIQTIGPWPWPRYYLARLTEQLTAIGAKVIAFDVLFPERDRVSPETFVSLYPELTPAAASEIKGLQPMDALFGTVVGQSPVVLAHAGVAEAQPGQAPVAGSPVRGKVPRSIDSWPAELSAIPEIDDVALGHGLINVRPDSDGVIRSVPLVIGIRGRARPGFAAEIARNFLDAEEIEVDGARVRIGKRGLPIDRSGRMRLHFGPFPGDKVVSAASILTNPESLEDGLFAGKPVIVGVIAEGTSDIAATPIAAEEYGPLIQAQAVDTILRGGWLTRTAWAPLAEWIVAGLLALLALANAIFGRANRIILLALFVAVPILSFWAFATSGLLLDPARPLVVGGGAVTGVALGLFALARKERERLREELLVEQLASAETAGELQAARAIQLGMVPPRSRLATLDRRVDLDALLEPARTVGGDYFDALKIDDDRLGFVIADVTGKGVPAALYMAMSKALSSAALSRMHVRPDAMAAAINTELLKDNQESMSVTMLLGILDLSSGDVEMVCAGHEDPLVIDGDGGLKRIALEGGPPFSIVDFSYPLESLTLKKEETLVLVTDGVTEAQNGAGELFGRDRILFDEADRQGSATAIVDGIRDDVRTFEEGTEATDDLTVMVIRYLGKD